MPGAQCRILSHAIASVSGVWGGPRILQQGSCASVGARSHASSVRVLQAVTTPDGGMKQEGRHTAATRHYRHLSTTIPRSPAEGQQPVATVHQHVLGIHSFAGISQVHKEQLRVSSGNLNWLNCKHKDYDCQCVTDLLSDAESTAEVRQHQQHVTILLKLSVSKGVREVIIAFITEILCN